MKVSKGPVRVMLFHLAAEHIMAEDTSTAVMMYSN